MIGINEHVIRLDVTVDEPAGMDGGQPREDGAQHGRGSVRGHGATLGEELAQGTAGNELHDEEDGIAVRGEVVNSHKVGVRQLRHRAGLTAETLLENRVTSKVFVHDFGRHRTTEAEVNAAVHGGHAAARDGTVNAIASVQNVAYGQSTHAFQYGRCPREQSNALRWSA